MKKRAFVCLVTLLFITMSTLAQEVPAGAIVAFKKGSSQELSRYMSDDIDLVILGKQTNANKNTALTLIADFFSTNKVSGFTVNHQGKRNESGYLIGTISTSNGDFRVNCFFKRIQNSYLIHQIRIEKTNE